MYLEYADYEYDQHFDADVVVIGTGAGGAVVGTELSEAGYSVIFLEEGGHHPTTSFNPYASESIPRLYRDGGSTVIFGNPPIPYAEGRCVGGSTVVNGGMAYRAPERALQAWAELTRAPELGPKGLEALYERVEKRVHAAPQAPESVGQDSLIMMEGAKRLGWEYSVNQRNQEACVGANNCVLGCPTGAKQSTLVSYMPHALQKGALCLTEVRAERLLTERGRACGVIGRAIHPVTRQADRELTVRARAVVVSAGAIQTPFFLQQHRVGSKSGQLGKNLLCHPNVKIVAVYPHDVMAWKGVSQNAQIREFRNDGLLFAENFLPPGVLAAHIPVHGNPAWELMRRYNQMIVSGVLMEDSTTGEVKKLLGMPHARYDITAFDHQRLLKGVRNLGLLHFEMGAEYILLPFSDAPTASSADELERICSTHRDRSTLELFTVHIMGTARMGATPADSVVDAHGQAWDVPGLYVADASLFPAAIGVNPQLSIMALSTRVAWHMDLRKKAA